MEMTQRGSGIWSYTLRSAGAILLTSVPATIITSDWRGEERGAKPKRSTSKRGIDTCIISIAQQASPNCIHISEPVRAQAIRLSAVATRNPLSDNWLLTLVKNGSTAVPTFSVRTAISSGFGATIVGALSSILNALCSRQQPCNSVVPCPGACHAVKCILEVNYPPPCGLRER